MIPSPTPKTPIRTPQPGSSNKSLQLTPIWEEVVKNKRLPPEVNENSIFQEISTRLEDPEWPVRQHAFRVLYDIIPVTANERLDERIVQNDILHKLVMNLGHPAPGVRKVAFDTVRQYLKKTKYSEKMLENFISFGVKEEGKLNTKNFDILRENVTLGTIISLVDLLRPFIFPENGGYTISPQLLKTVIEALGQKMKQPVYQDKAVESLWKIREMVGESRFQRALDQLPDKTLSLCQETKENVNLEDSGIDLKLNLSPKKNEDNSWSDETKSENSYGENPAEANQNQDSSDQSVDLELSNSVTTYHNYEMIKREKEWTRPEKTKNLDESTDEYSDATDTDTYTKEPCAANLAELEEVPERFVQMNETESEKPPSFTEVEKSCFEQPDPGRYFDVVKPPEESQNEEKSKEEELKVTDENETTQPASPKVVLETEIKFSEEKAIKMTIVEDETGNTGKSNEINLFPDDSSASNDSSNERRFVTEDGDLIMKILHDNEEVCQDEEEERKRTPRRVRFGGEVIKLRTPDSDATDITIEIHGVDGEGEISPRYEVIEYGNRPTTAHGKSENKVNGTQAKGAQKPKIERLVLPEQRGNQSHIPVPVSPATKQPQANFERPADVSPVKRHSSDGSKIPIIVQDNSPVPEGTEFLSSSSGSETELKERLLAADEKDFWRWSEFGLIDAQILTDLKNKTDWKIQYQALEQLKIVLIGPKTISKIGKSSDEEGLTSLFRCLLYKLPETNNQQITTLSVSIVSQLLQTLPKEKIESNLEDVVNGLCRYVGGCKNLNLKIESVQALKMLFGILEPSSVIDVLLGEHCLLSPSSKIRENSLLAVMYATMTFPSDLFNIEKILERACNSVTDSRRRVRHASLEAIAILSQFCSSETLTDNISRVADTLPSAVAKAGLISAVQARLSRRVLPTVSHEGLVLYALQIPASKRFGNIGNPIGTDVNWILSGTGSVSTGSARSRCQLNAAQRLEVTTPTSLSPTKWGNSSEGRSATFFNKEDTAKLENRRLGKENPWTIQKNRTELSNGDTKPPHGNWKDGENRFYKTKSTGNLSNRSLGKPKFSSNENLLEDRKTNGRNLMRGSLANRKMVGVFDVDSDSPLNPEEVTWALVPVSALEEQQLARGRNSALWTDLSVENGNQYFSSSLGAIRPLYLKLHPGQDQVSLSRSTDDLRRSSQGYGKHRVSETLGKDGSSQIRVLTPSVLRDRNKNEDLNSDISSSSRNDLLSYGENRGRIPPLDSSNSRKLRRNPRQYESNGTGDRKPFESESNSSIQRSIIANASANIITTPPAAVFLPNIHSNSHYDQPHIEKYAHTQKPPLQSRFSEIDEIKLQDTMTQLSGLLTTSKALSKSLPLTNRIGDVQPFHSGKNYMESEKIMPIRNGEKRSDDFGSSTTIANGHAQGKLFERAYPKSHQPPTNPVASAPAVITSNGRDPAPSTSSSNSTDIGIVSGSEMRIHRLNDSGALEITNNVSYRNLNNSYNQKVKAKRVALSKHCNKVSNNGNPFPDNLKPFERPKEGLDTCFSQLESQQWEVTMLGLTSLVRLLRHHPAIVLNQLHPVIVTLGRQIRNLRSQVSRAACQASAEMFVTLKRNLETDLEELASPLFHRSADTNRFIRADCNHALDNMVDNISPARVISVIITKGASHQNATVRTVSARLLLRMSEKLGPDKVLTLPKDVRDKMLLTGANLLMEGKLETRSFAKQLFRVWSSHPGFSVLIIEAIPPNVMRHISKTLISLKSQ